MEVTTQFRFAGAANLTKLHLEVAVWIKLNVVPGEDIRSPQPGSIKANRVLTFHNCCADHASQDGKKNE